MSKYQLPMDPEGQAKIWEKSEGCPSVPPPTIGDIFQKASEIAEAQGAPAACKKVWDTASYDNSVTVAVSGSMPLVSVSGSAKEQMTGMMNHNTEEGCGSILTTANNVLNSAQQMQCIINSSSTSTESVANMSNTVNIISQPLTTQEEMDRAKLLSKQQDTLNNMMKMYNDGVLKLLSTPGHTNSEVAVYQGMATRGLDGLNGVFKDQNSTYDRNISLRKTRIFQSVDGTIKTNVVVSNEDMTKLSAFAFDLAYHFF